METSHRRLRSCKRDKRLAAEQAKEVESAVAEKADGDLPAIDAKMLEPYFTAKYKGYGSSYKQFEFLIEKLENERQNSAATTIILSCGIEVFH